MQNFAKFAISTMNSLSAMRIAAETIALDNAMYPQSPLYSYDDYSNEITQNNTNNYFNLDIDERPFDDPLLRLVENNPDLLTLIKAVDSDFDLLDDIIHAQEEEEVQKISDFQQEKRNFKKETHTMENTLKPLNFWKKMIPNFHKILDHGCWCSSLAHNSNILPKTEPIDQLDYICQSWTICRRCTRETENSCQFNQNTTITERFNHNFECDAEDDCTNSLCRCNMHFVVEVSQYFRDFYGEFVSDVDEGFEAEVVGREQCGFGGVREEDLFGVRVDEIEVDFGEEENAFFGGLEVKLNMS